MPYWIRAHPCLCPVWQQQQELVLTGSRWIWLCFTVQCGCTLPASTLVPSVVKGCIPDSCLLVTFCRCVRWFDNLRMCKCSFTSVICGRKFKSFPVPCVVNVCWICFEWCNSFCEWFLLPVLQYLVSNNSAFT